MMILVVRLAPSVQHQVPPPVDLHDYGYLLNMAIRSLSEKKKDELLKQRDKKVGLIISSTA